MFKNSEKGVSLIITFFILVIVLAVVLSISVILYSEIKIIRNIGDSVVAFYAADAGVEKTLYYDRKVVPDGATGSKRGVCNLCNSCPNTECLDCDVPVTDGCNATNCENCIITFNTTLSASPKKTYSVTATVRQMFSPDNPSVIFSELTIDSTGSYASATNAKEVKRAIELTVIKDETKGMVPKVLDSSFISFKTQPEGTSVIISADINAYGHGIKSVKAHIYTSATSYEPFDLLPDPDNINNYIGAKSGLDVGSYYVGITACDNQTPSKCSVETLIEGVGGI